MNCGVCGEKAHALITGVKGDFYLCDYCENSFPTTQIVEGLIFSDKPKLKEKIK